MNIKYPFSKMSMKSKWIWFDICLFFISFAIQFDQKLFMRLFISESMLKYYYFAFVFYEFQKRGNVLKSITITIESYIEIRFIGTDRNHQHRIWYCIIITLNVINHHQNSHDLNSTKQCLLYFHFLLLLFKIYR